MRLKNVVAIAVLVPFTSCATLRHGDQEAISVTSDPAGAVARVRCANGVAAEGVTPARLMFPRVSQGCVVELTRDGYQPHTIPLERGYNAAFWTNFVPASGIAAALPAAFGGYQGWGALLGIGVAGTLGFAVDRMTGRGYGHEPDRIDVKLQAKP